jgi:aspartyl-tRNA(Asn)/glutamyl-tRNA(Gln) amidotransferase subunit C
MQITDDLIDQLATLARLRFAEAEREQLREEFSKMVNFVQKVQEVDTEGYEPLMHITPAINRLREDRPEQPISHEEALQNAPKKDSDYFRVPKFVDND